MSLQGKYILITGSAKRIGRFLAITAAKAGANIILHYGHSNSEAQSTAREIEKLGANCLVISADLSNPGKAIEKLESAFYTNSVYALVNNASTFESVKFLDTSLSQWQRHLDINLTSPFLISQLFVQHIGQNEGRIINILDWRALRPGRDHFPYTISKAALAAMTQAMAVSLAPNIQVNGFALGAILPPEDGSQNDNILKQVPTGRWATLEEVGQVFIFLLDSPTYMTGEIIHLDGGRHLV